MRVLIDTTILIEFERGVFALDEWVLQQRAEAFICDAAIVEFLAGEPIKDEGKKKRFRECWETFVSQLRSFPLDRQVCEKAGALLYLARTKGRTVPLGDALHGAVAELEGLQVLTTDITHFSQMGVSATNPLENPPGEMSPEKRSL